MITNQLKLENTNVEVLSMFKNEGVFVNEKGDEINFENYTGKLKIGDEKIRFKVEKSSKPDMDDAVNDNNLLDI